MPKGSWFEVDADFDNSEFNPANQNKPPKLVRWGEGTNDEMCIGIYEWTVVEDKLELNVKAVKRSPNASIVFPCALRNRRDRRVARESSALARAREGWKGHASRIFTRV